MADGKVYEVTSPDGKVYEVTAPPGATKEQALDFARMQFDTLQQRNRAAQAKAADVDAADPASGMGTGERFLAGAGKGMHDLGTGAVGALKSAVGMETPADRANVDAQRLRDAPLMRTPAGALGDIGGKVATTIPAMMVPGANSYRGAAILGAITGATQPAGTEDSRLLNTATGAAGGVIGQGATNRIAAVINPTVRPNVRALMDQGITPTPGQISGGFLQRAEDKLTSLPITGDAISAARTRGLDDFNRAAYNRVLAPIGEKYEGEVGREGIRKVAGMISDKYDTLLPKLSFKADQQFGQELSTLQSMIPVAQKAQFDQILKTKLLDKMTSAGLMNGESLKAAEGELGRLARGYRSSQNFDERQLGDAILELQSAMRQNLARGNPAHADELSKINEGFANLVRVERAAGFQGAQNGVFTPALLSAAVKAGDQSVRKNAFSKGGALMQDLSDAGKDVLASKYPDSGTAGRVLLGGGAIASGIANPAIPAGLAAAAVPYLPKASNLAAYLLTQRPQQAQAIADMLRRGSPLLSGAGASVPALAQQ